jgi:hypothetical protein
MSVLFEAAHEVVANIEDVTEDDRKEFGVTFLMVIVQILQQIIPILQDCDVEPEKVASTAKRPNYWQRRILRWQTRKALGGRRFRKYGAQVANSILDTGAHAKVAVVAAAYEEVND